MNTLIVIPSFFIFLYIIYKLVKDDHVFFRRNIKLEQFFDYIFIITISSWIFIHIMHAEIKDYLTYVILVSGLLLLIIAKYKKIPVGRFFDFFTISFITAVPSWYLFLGLLVNSNERFIYFLSAAFYLIIAIVFIRVLYPKIMSRTLREGSMSALFLMLYSLFSLIIMIFQIVYNKSNLITVGNIIIVLILLASFPLLLKIQK